MDHLSRPARFMGVHRSITLAAAAAIVAFFGIQAATATLSAAALDATRRAHRPLDLPAGGSGIDEDDIEEPGSIVFYGATFEGDAFFWCLDRSGSMEGGRLQVLKDEVTQALRSLSRTSEFSIVMFSSNMLVLSELPLAASVPNKLRTTEWVRSVTASGGTCMAAPAVKTLQIAHRSHKQRRVMVLLSDGLPYCGSETPSSVINVVTQANYSRIPINTIFVGDDAAGAGFMRQLAAQNGGTFTTVGQ